MAKEAKRGGKTETLTIRLDPKTRFMLDYLSRLKGQTITTVVERAIISAASQETLPNYTNGIPDGWQDLWDVSEGVRALKVARRSELFPSYEEERRLAFAREHWPFFYASQKRDMFLTFYVDVLWPRIDDFIQIHDETKTSDYFAAGKAMQSALREAKLGAPEWPIPSQPQKQIEKPKRPIGDDEIPF